MDSEIKKRKINPPKRSRSVSPTPTPTAKVHRPKETPSIKVLPSSRNSSSMERVKNFAITQAQQDGCTSNFRIFDSQFGNFLIPVIPTRAELSE